MTAHTPRLKSFAPQLLVDDLKRAMAFYRDVLGFAFGEPWQGFYAIGARDGFAVHLKCAPKTLADRDHRRAQQHLDVYADVAGVRALYEECRAKGATIIKPLEATPWGTSDFYLADPDGYILAFGERSSS
jgi:uncharacterized glyoxalase superfamily protein PhnB